MDSTTKGNQAKDKFKISCRLKTKTMISALRMMLHCKNNIEKTNYGNKSKKYQNTNQTIHKRDKEAKGDGILD